MLQERAPSSGLEQPVSATGSAAKPLAAASKLHVRHVNPSLLPDHVYFALKRARDAEAKLTVRLTYREIERCLAARLKWPM